MAQSGEPGLLEEAYAAERQRDIASGLDLTHHSVHASDLRTQTDMMHAWLEANQDSSGDQ